MILKSKAKSKKAQQHNNVTFSYSAWVCSLNCLVKPFDPLNPAYYKIKNTRTRNYGTQNCGTLTEHQNAGGTLEHWRNAGILAEQYFVVYHEILEREKCSGITEQ